jgi:RNA polymerase sigma-70 factor, ECF subfamily
MDALMVRWTTFATRDTAADAAVPTQPIAATLATDFDALYRRHYRDVYRFALGLTRSSDDAADVVAETFERAFRAWSGGSQSPERPQPWLLLTARRIATDRWRRARRLTSLLQLGRAREEDRPDETRTEFWLWFDAVSRVLSDRQRAVLLLRYQRDLTDADIATILGISESGVRSLVARAVAILRAHPELLR